jgi:hypothetical protein
MNNQNQTKEPLSLDVITAAIGGDEEAMKAVVKHYEGYIYALSAKRLYDEDGRQYLFVDDELRRELEMKLITKVATFKTQATQAA